MGLKMTITLDQAKKLWELGVRKKAEKNWGVMDDENRGKPRITMQRLGGTIYDKLYSAYSAEELVAMVEGSYRIAVCGDKSIRIGSDCYTDTFEALTITQALGEKLIYDLENGIIAVEEINK